jgi:hypothetical protein
MMREYRKTIDRLDALYRSLSSRAPDEYFLSIIASHICILQSGILENVIKESLGDYCDKRCTIEVANFVKKRLNDLHNPRTERLEELLGSFSDNWRNDLLSFWGDGETKGHINSIVANRNQIAHGRTTTVTISQTKDWLRSVKRFADYIEGTFLKP